MAVTTIDKGVEVFKKWRNGSPEGKMEAKVTDIDKRLVTVEQLVIRHNELFGKDKARFETLEEGNRITQEALLALLSHAIDGNDKEACHKAKDDLNKYLIHRK